MKKIILAIFMLSVLSVKTDAGFNFGITNAIKKQSQKLDEKIEKKVYEETMHNPVLSWLGAGNYVSDGLDPETGDANTTYYFRIKYTDSDNNAPKTGYPKLHIEKDGIAISTNPFTMVAVDSNTFSVGRVYEYAVVLPTASYTYYFSAFDTTSLPAIGTPATIEMTGPTSSFSKKWTVMSFMSYDNDLEGCALEDLKEMAQVGSTSNLNVVVQFDRHPKGETDNHKPNENYSNEAVLNIPNWTTAKRFYMRQGSLEEKADLGEVDMASSATLSGFIQWAVTNYPADKYVLIFGDHGAAWTGFGTDETTSDDAILSLEDIDSAMLEATQKTGINKFDLIGFDACLQADIQTLHIMKQYGKIYVASEEIEPGFGWQYDQILTYLKNNLNTTPQDLGRKIADSYKSSFDQATEEDRKNQGLGITLSVIDLEKVAQVETALNGLASAMKQLLSGEGAIGTRTDWLKIAEVNKNTENYGKGGEGDESTYAFDIYDFSKLLMDKSTDSWTQQQAYNCMTAIDSAVLYRIKGTDKPQSHGITVYFPPY